MNNKSARPENLKEIVHYLFSKAKLVPRDHQWRTICKILVDLAATSGGQKKFRNYLIQQATGSGKSLTIACLTYCLTKMVRDGGGLRKFRQFLFFFSSRIHMN
eukprot:TRINITY_DN7262_c0_g1_i2.p1 TRINITY_DN7262_c0_g1~~TRINITY_DN7262_c0_g1_i2.p1  ORF type:complete len:103 (+),score=16.88 TRINITY_DN7262_c0_g1_i2:154-462(+)